MRHSFFAQGRSSAVDLQEIQLPSSNINSPPPLHHIAVGFFWICMDPYALDVSDACTRNRSALILNQ
ncbi:hypothetical protein VNO77_27618 [Canavalia gladiata]|uniref:Uncharacterized protein n=1 Tax=Canavalia gladiata TaxID=3824 RepID=A0AAN9KX90_CANGL